MSFSKLKSSVLENIKLKKNLLKNFSEINDIKNKINKLDDKLLRGNVIISKNTLCNDVEILLKRYDNKKQDGNKWYYKPEEYFIYFGSS